MPPRKPPVEDSMEEIEFVGIEELDEIEGYLLLAAAELDMEIEDSKRLKKMRGNPNGDWRIEDVIAVCKEYGVGCTSPKSGSHYKVSHPTQTEILTVPFKRPIKSVYIKRLVAFIDAVRRSK